jgi:hypothetical protein
LPDASIGTATGSIRLVPSSPVILVAKSKRWADRLDSC